LEKITHIQIRPKPPKSNEKAYKTPDKIKNKAITHNPILNSLGKGNNGRKNKVILDLFHIDF
jgi:hypothetical protein